MADEGVLDLQVETNLRQVLADLKEFDPRLATATRRRLRQSGDEAIAEMRDVLSQPSPGIVTRTRTAVTTSSLDGRTGLRRRVRLVGVETQDAQSSRSRGSRQAVAGALKTQVSTGKTRQGIKLRGSGTPFARSYNMTVWRHPIRFNPATTSKDDVPWVSQGGRPYFGAVILKQSTQIRTRVYEALDEALAELARERAGLSPLD